MNDNIPAVTRAEVAPGSKVDVLDDVWTVATVDYERCTAILTHPQHRAVLWAFKLAEVSP